MAFDSLDPVVAFARGGRVKKVKKVKKEKAKKKVKKEVKQKKPKKQRKETYVTQEAKPFFGYKVGAKFEGQQPPMFRPFPSWPMIPQLPFSFPSYHPPSSGPDYAQQVAIKEALSKPQGSSAEFWMGEEISAEEKHAEADPLGTVTKGATWVAPAGLAPVFGNININKPSIEMGGRLPVQDVEREDVSASKMKEAMPILSPPPIASPITEPLKVSKDTKRAMERFKEKLKSNQ